jgi:hypothetical protein
MNASFSVVDFLAGAVAFAFIIAGLYFCRFWRKTGDGLFLGFGVAFWLFAANRIIVSVLRDNDERSTDAYILRILGFLIILYAVLRKNSSARREQRLG